MEVQQSTMRASRSSAPLTLVNDWFMPANEACPLSSPVAEDRTATTTSGPSWR